MSGTVVNIVVGYVLTPEGKAAVERAAELAAESDGELHLVGVVALPRNDSEAREYQQRRTADQKQLEHAAQGFESKGIRSRAHIPNAVTRPSEAILGVAKSVEASLIVIGMRRRSKVGKLVLGSTAQEILLDSTCDVLSVKAPKAQPD